MSRTEELFSSILVRECPDSTYRPKENPLVLERAKDSLVYDADGRAYIDLCAGFGVLPFGHSADYLVEILKNSEDQSAVPKIIHGLGDVYPSTDKIKFYDQLFSAMPPRLADGKAAVALTGAQAIELALKTAILSTGRRNFLAFENSYHGLDLGVLPVTWRADFKEPFSNYLRHETSKHLPYGCDLDAVRAAYKHASEENNPFAAIIVEPVQGRGGVIPGDISWLKGLQKIAHEHGALLIFDEVFTGFGRTGRITYADEVDVDLVCFGKAMGGGFPLSVCVGTASAMDAWPACESEALHTGTFFGHPLSCRVATETIRRIKDSDVITASIKKGEWLRLRLKEELDNFSQVVAIRGRGMMTGIEFKSPGFGAVMMERLRAMGVIAIPSGPSGNVLSITPALNIETGLLNDAILRIKKALSASCNE